MKFISVLASFLFTINAYAGISHFTGKWVGQGSVTIDAGKFVADPVKLDFAIINGEMTYQDAFSFKFQGNDMTMHTDISHIRFINNGFYYENKKVGELIGNKIHSDYIASNGVRQIITLQVSGEQMTINKKVIKPNGTSITQFAVVTKENQ